MHCDVALIPHALLHWPYMRCFSNYQCFFCHMRAVPIERVPVTIAHACAYVCAVHHSLPNPFRSYAVVGGTCQGKR